MSNRTRKPLLAMIALGAAMAMPMAFAQSDTTDAQAAQEADALQTAEVAQDAANQPQTETAPPADSAAGASMQSPQQSATSAGQQGWEQIDSNGDGVISKEESANNAGLSQIFDQADADSDGNLTTDEYRSFVEQNYAEPQPK